MMLFDPSHDRTSKDAHQVAQAALILAEQAYARGNADDAAHLVDVAHRLFGAALEASGLYPAH